MKLKCKMINAKLIMMESLARLIIKVLKGHPHYSFFINH